MAFTFVPLKGLARWCALGLLPLLAACQSNVTGSALLEHQMQSDKLGLTAVTNFAAIHASVAPPRNWTLLPTSQSIFYTHQQWRSPNHATGIGVAYIRLPLPTTPEILLFLARTQYNDARKSAGADVTASVDKQWTDALGRLWFEAQDDNYHVRGYAMTRGLEAWIVYSGHRVRGTARDSDIAMADRTADAVVPFFNPQPAIAAANPPGHY